jgi:hypothetical protein
VVRLSEIPLVLVVDFFFLKKTYQKLLALQLLFTPIGYPGLQIVSKLHLSMYTAPAYFACAMNFFGVLALFFLFKEKYAGIIEKEKGETKVIYYSYESVEEEKIFSDR